MKKYNVYFNLTLVNTFDTIEEAIEYINSCGYPTGGRYYIQ